MRILVTGATGYIGGRLVPRLRERGWDVRCLARSAERLRGRFDTDVEIIEGDVFDAASLMQAMRGCDAAYYLVHSMTSVQGYVEADRDAARTFGICAHRCGLKKIVYLGGLGSDDEDLSAHLKSRHEVGDMLRLSGVPVIEFRAAQIIGSGSISFEMMRYLTERLPMMIAPRWVVTRVQPISISDVLAYLIAGIDRPDQSMMYEIGGSDVMTYREMMLRFARIRGLKRHIVVVPFLTPQLSSYWVHIVTPISASIAQPLIRGLYNEVIVHDRSAVRDFPDIVPIGFDLAVKRALDRYSTVGPETTWFDAFDQLTPAGDFTGVTEGMLIDRRERTSPASPSAIARVFSGLGGRRGWLVADGLWRMRGWLDRLFGGVGMRRGRRSSDELRLGDAVDFWRVETYEPGRMLRLRAEMKLPGSAWLQFEVEPIIAGGSRLRQTAFFEPHGLFGYLYWYSVAPFHEWIFAQMASRIVHEAEIASGAHAS